MPLAWDTTLEINGVNTKRLIDAAIDRATDLCGDIGKPTLIADSGSENVNSDVYGMKKENLIDIKIAQIEIDESNSAAEVIFRMAKHNDLFFQNLDNLDLSRSIAIFIFTSTRKLFLIRHSRGQLQWRSIL